MRWKSSITEPTRRRGFVPSFRNDREALEAKVQALQSQNEELEAENRALRERTEEAFEKAEEGQNAQREAERLRAKLYKEGALRARQEEAQHRRSNFDMSPSLTVRQRDEGRDWGGASIVVISSSGAFLGSLDHLSRTHSVLMGSIGMVVGMAVWVIIAWRSVDLNHGRSVHRSRFAVPLHGALSTALALACYWLTREGDPRITAAAGATMLIHIVLVGWFFAVTRQQRGRR